MTVIMGLTAATVIFFYSFYFWRIIKGSPEGFELGLLQGVAHWMMLKGSNSRRLLWLILAISVFLEVVYFLLVLAVIKNTFLLILTGIFVAFEALHMITCGVSLKRFFRSDIKLKNLFNWRMERISAMLFFTHSLLVLISIIAF